MIFGWNFCYAGGVLAELAGDVSDVLDVIPRLFNLVVRLGGVLAGDVTDVLLLDVTPLSCLILYD